VHCCCVYTASQELGQKPGQLATPAVLAVVSTSLVCTRSSMRHSRDSARTRLHVTKSTIKTINRVHDVASSAATDTQYAIWFLS
jgi:hypothetical protein